jgi:hypothetical protein
MAFTVFTAELPRAMAEAISGKPHNMYLYLEYASSGTAPTYNDSTAISASFADPKTYYNNLGSNANYIRVPALRDPNVALTSSDPYTATTNFFGQSSAAVAGVNPSGAGFGTGVDCYGAALVLVVDEADRTKDLIMARAYFTDDVLTKSAASELFVTFPFVTTVSG